MSWANFSSFQKTFTMEYTHKSSSAFWEIFDSECTHKSYLNILFYFLKLLRKGIYP